MLLDMAKGMSMNIWAFQRLVTQRLLEWSIASTAIGMVMWLRGGRFWEGVASQFIGWAVVNMGIAFFGSEGTRQRRQRLLDPDAPPVLAQERESLRRLLLFNAGLDVLYMIGGRALMNRRKSGPWTRGVGLGIILQGAYLFYFDLKHARDLDEGRATQDNA